jgi:hypothetical protein
MADIKAALADARLVAKTAGNARNTGNTENNSSDIKPFGAIELAAINQERLATPATQAGGGLLPMLPLAKSGNVEVATEKTLVKQQLSEPVTDAAGLGYPILPYCATQGHDLRRTRQDPSAFESFASWELDAASRGRSCVAEYSHASDD